MQFDGSILTLAEHLPIGAVRRVVCPFCQGGDKHEVTFVVGREADRVWFKCFRATCDSKPGVTGAASLPAARAAEYDRALERMRPYYGATRPLEDKDRDYFWHRFELAETSLDAYTTDHDEYILPVRGPRRELRGYVQRQPVWKGTPKAPRQGRTWDPESDKAMPKTKLYMHTTQPTISWYRRGPNLDTVVLVEDQLSAMKVADVCKVSAVALLGNSLTIEGVRDIYRLRPSRVYVALDPGAEGAAQSLAKKWGLYFERTSVVPLDYDPKDMEASDLAREFR